ncbi:Asparaginase/glutaminase [Fragilariopsis cylindrus CCMP1102]|uniref:Asparaginase/glutaminase n=1 Tax=Fragilariopsis cylindrus CCMP1102 TaxID=635003 RepID=A0A1E7FTF9_9STRA|nr:Asparaginase/glutaminase [Fragilariopsis cylindrus CCMP1102]|eukprot:OEU21460.1 Asparaginase/glutaminase [Fragilariopsis cylindrus CCMP1102]
MKILFVQTGKKFRSVIKRYVICYYLIIPFTHLTIFLFCFCPYYELYQIISYFVYSAMLLLSTIILGGTIDKDYPKTTNGQGFEISNEPAFDRILKERLSSPVQPPLSFEYDTLTVCRKDSLEITNDDRNELIRLIDGRLTLEMKMNTKAFDGVIITHGTDTMGETAKYIANSRCQLSPHFTPIVITGAMRPERFSNSDADFNLGMAVATIQLSKMGFIGLCMNGIIIPHDEYDRDLTTGQFLRRRRRQIT